MVYQELFPREVRCTLRERTEESGYTGDVEFLPTRDKQDPDQSRRKDVILKCAMQSRIFGHRWGRKSGKGEKLAPILVRIEAIKRRNALATIKLNELIILWNIYI